MKTVENDWIKVTIIMAWYSYHGVSTICIIEQLKEGGNFHIKWEKYEIEQWKKCDPIIRT